MHNTLNRPVTIRAWHLAAALAIAGLLVLAGCGGKFTEPFRDAGVNAQNSSKSTEVFQPDGFSNLAVKCVVPGVLAATTYHGDRAYGAVALVLDPACKTASTPVPGR